MTFAILLAAAAIGMPAGAAAPPASAQVHWPSFRGPGAAGVAEGAAAPVRWDVASGEHVLWKTAIPGLGHSSPVVWGERLFVTTAVSGREAPLKVGLYGDIAPADDDGTQSWRVLCLDKRSGEILWQRTLREGVPRTRRHPKSSHANPTPATDGRRLVAFFGPEGLYALDLDGNLLWQKDLGALRAAFYRVPEAEWGFASSPVIHEGRVFVQADVLGGSFLAAFDLEDGREIWRTARDDVPAWSTPTIHRVGGRAQVLVNGHRHMGAYDAATGREIWRLAGGGDIPVPTPVAAHGLVFLTSAHGGPSPIFAVRETARGELSASADGGSGGPVAWSVPRDGAYMPTPLVVGEHLYVARDGGALYCYEAKTGRLVYRERLSGAITASGVAADGKLYFAGESGDVDVVRAGPEFERLATNRLGETVLATPAVSEGVLFFRTRGHLVAIGEPPASARPKDAPPPTR